MGNIILFSFFQVCSVSGHPDKGSCRPFRTVKAQFLIHRIDLGSGRDRAGQEDITADHRTFPDHSIAPQDRSTGIDRYIVFNGRIKAL